MNQVVNVLCNNCFPSYLFYSLTYLFICLKWQYPSEEDMIEWAKRESEREEEQRLARLNQQEQEDLELAIALSKSEISEAWRILLSFVNHTVFFFLNTEALYSVYENYLWAWEYKRFEIPVNVTKVWFCFLLHFRFVFFSPCKSSNPVRQLQLGPYSDVHLLWAFCLPVLLLVKLEHPSFCLLEYREIVSSLCYPLFCSYSDDSQWGS